MNRVTVPVSDELYDAVTTLAEVRGGGRGRVLAELMEAMEPMLIASAAGFRAAQALDEEQRREMLEGMASASQAMLMALGGDRSPDDVVAVLERGFGDIASLAAESAPGRTGDRGGNGGDAGAARNPTDRARPPRTNRGVHDEI